MGLLDRFRGVTPLLIFSFFIYSQGGLLYGIDTGSFGSLQALPSFLRVFGELDPKKGKYVLSTARKSKMNSIPFIGKAIGAYLHSPILDKIGYKYSLALLGAIQCIAIVIEMTSQLTKNYIQFTFARVLAYIAVGLAENVVTHYCSETSPANLRGLMAGLLILANAFGAFWGVGMSRAFSTEISPKGWLVPVGVQLIPGLIILTGVWFTPESPRWLVLKGRKDEALRQLNRLRTPEDIDAGYTAVEIDAFEQSFLDSGSHDQGTWMDLFSKKYRYRTWIAFNMMILQQFNGSQFANSYSATLFVQYGLGAKSFTYTLIGNACGIVNCLFMIFTMDYIGRRPFAIVGGLLGFISLAMVAGIGGSGNRAPAAVNAVIAGQLMSQIFARWGIVNGFVIGAEIGGLKMRKKIMAFIGVWDVVAAIMITSINPYLQDPDAAGLGPKVGWIYGSCCILLFLHGIFFTPELKGRSLEEIDELFDAGLRWGWQFKNYKTHSVGATISALENHENTEGIMDKIGHGHEMDTAQRQGTTQGDEKAYAGQGDRAVPTV